MKYIFLATACFTALFIGDAMSILFDGFALSFGKGLVIAACIYGAYFYGYMEGDIKRMKSDR